VSDLLDSDRRGWNYGKIVAIFNLANVEAIARINLSERQTGDVLAWFYKNPESSARSAYHVGPSLQESPLTTATGSTPDG